MLDDEDAAGSWVEELEDEELVERYKTSFRSIAFEQRDYVDHYDKGDIAAKLANVLGPLRNEIREYSVLFVGDSSVFNRLAGKYTLVKKKIRLWDEEDRRSFEFK